MSFRDDREAMLARLDALERENAQLRRENADLQRELATRPPAPPPRPPDPSAWHCSQCQRENAGHYKFCLTCGQEMPAPAWSCTQCGRGNDASCQCCVYCGAGAPSRQPQPTPVASRPSSDAITCPCGHANAPYYKFCLGCGAELRR